jgi:hypothetical protein
MKKRYTIKATKRAFLEVEADHELSQQEVYELAKEKVNKSKSVKWDEPTFNIIEINVDSSSESDNKTKVKMLQPE